MEISRDYRRRLFLLEGYLTLVLIVIFTSGRAADPSIRRRRTTATRQQ
jgi:hypothetical protein